MRILILTLCLFSTVSDASWLENMVTPFNDPLGVVTPQTSREFINEGQDNTCHQKWQSVPKPLSLLTAVELAICHNPQIRSSWAEIQSQTAQLGVAKASYLPTMNVTFNYSNQQTIYPESQFSVNTNRTSDSRYTTLTWRLLDFGGREANYNAAQFLLDAALAKQDAVFQKTIASVVGLYFDAQTARADRDAKEKNIALAKETLKTALNREQRGSGAQSDSLQAKTSLAKAELEGSRAFGNYEKTISALFVVLGFSMQKVALGQVVLAQDYESSDKQLERDLMQWLSIAQEQHPSIIAARAQIKAAKEKLAVAISEGLPTVDLNMNQYINGLPSQGLTSSQMEQSMVGLSLTYPLFEGFARGYKVQDARAQIALRASDLQDVENQVLGDIAKAHADAVSAMRNIVVSQQLLESSLEALESVKRKYHKGVADILEMLSVQSAHADAQQERIRTLSEWRSARLRLFATTGNIGMKELRDEN